jgi:hypothetical protein
LELHTSQPFWFFCLCDNCFLCCQHLSGLTYRLFVNILWKDKNVCWVYSLLNMTQCLLIKWILIDQLENIYIQHIYLIATLGTQYWVWKGLEFVAVMMCFLLLFSLIWISPRLCVSDHCNKSTNCFIFDWQPWSVCTGSCRTPQTRMRLMCCPTFIPVRTLNNCLAACNKPITIPMKEQRICCEQGHFNSGKCICDHGYKGTCCQGY